MIKRLGLAIGSAVRSTNVAVPISIEFGLSELGVVANGIASAAFPVTIAPAT